MSNNTSKIALLGAMGMMSSQSAYTNAYEGLTDYSDRPYSNSKPKPKPPLSKKQKKARAKSKVARKARKK